MNQDLSILQLVLGASFVVQLVMLLLVVVSVVSWAAIFRKLFALKRVLKRLSRKLSEVPLHPEPSGCLLRIDLRDLDWDGAHEWSDLLKVEPYGVRYDAIQPDEALRKLAREIVHLTTSLDSPCVRGDWFIAAATRAPLYDHLQQLSTAHCRPVTLERAVRGYWWRAPVVFLCFHFTRFFPAIAGWLPAHTQRLKSLHEADEGEFVYDNTSSSADNATGNAPQSEPPPPLDPALFYKSSKEPV